jgi:DNA-binding HxlR family transcriptional regulator
MMAGKSESFTCGLHATLALIGAKWKPLILYFLSQKTRRYGELRRCLRDVSDKVLIQQLKELEADGLVLRNDFGEVPPRVEYSLTPFGESIITAMEPLCNWGAENETTILAAKNASSKLKRLPENQES